MPRTESMLLVDDEPDFAAGLARLIELEFPEIRVRVANSGEKALEILERDTPALLVTDLRMPGISGLELLRKTQAANPDLTVILLTAFGDIGTAVEAIKAGAYDFLTKPAEREVLVRMVAKALERARFLAENRHLRTLLAKTEGSVELVGDSPAMQRLQERLASVAATEYTVLITGESGTGKEMVAKTIVRRSPRAERSFLSINCPAIPGPLLESELFGHVKGAFTGAERNHKGLFLEASGGTLLLDEIGDMDPAVQTKLLRVLQEREVRPVGASRSVKVDARILATTNQNLEAKMRSGEFREDLYHRLNVLAIHIPPLRERREDIPLLVRHYLAQTCAELDIEPKDVSPEVQGWLASQPWPGNVRELGNCVRRLVVHSRGQVIDREQLARCTAAEPDPADERDGLRPYLAAKQQILDEFSTSYVGELLRRTRGNISEAARLSGLERWSLQKMLKRLGIEASDYSRN